MEPNRATLEYLKERNVESFDVMVSDRDSQYEKEYLLMSTIWNLR